MNYYLLNVHSLPSKKGLTGFIPIGTEGGPSIKSNIDFMRHRGHRRCGSVRVTINLSVSEQLFRILLWKPSVE